DPSNPFFAGDPQLDDWTAACGGNHAQLYPYGAHYDPTACNGRDLGTGGTTTVRTPPSCEGADDGVYGLSGNVWEWEDACSDPVSPDGVCLTRGGSFRSDRVDLQCDGVQTRTRTEAADDLGFRCCID